MLIGGISLLILVVLLLSGAPVLISFAAAVLFMVVTGGYDPQFLLPYSYARLSSMTLMAFPLFILAGGLMEQAGIAKYLVDFANIIVSKVRGGLGAVGAIACGIFGASSGAATAAISCIGPIMIPRLESAGYPRNYATAFMTSAAGLAMIIPPSGHMILFGWLTYTSVTALFLAGMFPGILLMLLFILINWIIVGRMPVEKPRPWGSIKQLGKDLGKSSFRSFPALMFPVIVLGSIYGGISSPTEAGGVAVIYSVLVGFLIYRTMTPKGFAGVMLNRGILVGVVLIMLLCAMMLVRMFVNERIPEMVAAGILAISENKYVVLLLMNIVLIFLGMVMDDASAILVSSPLLFPLGMQIGIHPVHLGTIVCINTAMGTMTPPMAPLLYVGQRIGDISFPEMIKPSMMLVIFAYLPATLITTYWPALSLWLPTAVLGPKVMGLG